MPVPTSPDLNTLLLRLYGLAGERPLDLFQDATLDLLKQMLPFDSAMWGVGVQTPRGFDMQLVHLHEQPQEMLESYGAVRHLDSAAAEIARKPRAVCGLHAPSWFSRREQAPLREHGRRFEQANFFISADGDPDSGLFQWMTLFRADERALCSADECALLALLTPHLMQALALNRRLHHEPGEAGGVAGGVPGGRAICGPNGLYCQRDAEYDALLRTEWEAPAKLTLPAAVLASFQCGETRYFGQRIVIGCRAEHGLLFLRARPRHLADALGTRERAVAELAARGLNHKEIARQLGRSPATVRNQMQAVYRKLEVNRLAGLIEQLRLAW